MRPARRVRRALPLPNSVRASATRRKSATVVCSSGRWIRVGGRRTARHARRGALPPGAWHVDHGVRTDRLPRRATVPLYVSRRGDPGITPWRRITWLGGRGGTYRPTSGRDHRAGRGVGGRHADLGRGLWLPGRGARG